MEHHDECLTSLEYGLKFSPSTQMLQLLCLHLDGDECAMLFPTFMLPPTMFLPNCPSPVQHSSLYCPGPVLATVHYNHQTQTCFTRNLLKIQHLILIMCKCSQRH